MAADDESGQFWFNVATKQVEEGHRSSWQDLMGPYSTREEAARALEQAAARTKAWYETDAREQD